MAVALDHLDDQLLADVAREVEVDVGDGYELAVEETAKRQPGRNRIHVREPGEVADDRPDGAPSPPARRQEVAWRAPPAHLEGDLTRQLEHLPMKEEETREPELGDERELFSQPGVRLRAELGGGVAIALLEGAGANLGQLHVGRVRPVGEVGIAVAELVREV